MRDAGGGVPAGGRLSRRLEKKMRDAKIRDVAEAHRGGVIDDRERAAIETAAAAVQRVVAVDAFPMEEVSPIAHQHRRDAGDPRREAAE
jgi:acyl-CoA dehydrogenase